ncbi:hypothetical protein D910_07517 [Dendroctonus ponderosae]|uniref:Reverse transcriptase domain-containing protein n=1 Tax=Dendroctonus ponderosae TaxID=77166 RepID=U4UCW4_DENPD|nr:hypothetical protein D910_07517 [Dendroctonus ponderosae]
MALVDVRNAFNSAPWKLIVEKIQKGKISQSLGSMLGPTLWNVLYDDVMDLEVDETTELICYADKKTKWRSKKEIVFPFVKEKLRPIKKVKYLGFHIDKSLEPIEACKKAKRVTKALKIILANTDGRRSSKRKTLALAMQSIIICQRQMAMSVCMAYNTVSSDAVLVLAGLILLHLFTRERRNLQEMVNSGKKCRAKKHEEYNYHLSQALSGHGSFSSYLCKIKKRNDTVCDCCGSQEDSARHTIFECLFWEDERKQVEEGLGVQLPADNFLEEMLKGEREWSEFNGYVTRVMRGKGERVRGERRWVGRNNGPESHTTQSTNYIVDSIPSRRSAECRKIFPSATKKKIKEDWRHKWNVAPIHKQDINCKIVAKCIAVMYKSLGPFGDYQCDTSCTGLAEFPGSKALTEVLITYVVTN